MMQVDPATYKSIAQAIHSEDSPVGIDAKKTHILILSMLIDINDRLKNLEAKLSDD